MGGRGGGRGGRGGRARRRGGGNGDARWKGGGRGVGESRGGVKGGRERRGARSLSHTTLTHTLSLALSRTHKLCLSHPLSHTPSVSLSYDDRWREREVDVSTAQAQEIAAEMLRSLPTLEVKSHLQTLMIHKLGFNQNYYTFTLIVPIQIVLCI